MSLKRMPGLGKSGTSRMNFLISSMNYSPSVEILDFKAVLFNKESRVLQPQKAAGPRVRRGWREAAFPGRVSPAPWQGERKRRRQAATPPWADHRFGSFSRGPDP